MTNRESHPGRAAKVVHDYGDVFEIEIKNELFEIVHMVLQPVSLGSDQCPIARSLDAIGDWWSLLIVRDALDGLRRFGEFHQSLGISKNILTMRLRQLVSDGILKTVPAADGSRHQEYILSKKGVALFPVIVSLRQWGEDHFYQKSEAHSVLIERKTRKPVERLELRSKDGRALRAENTVRYFPKGSEKK